MWQFISVLPVKHLDHTVPSWKSFVMEDNSVVFSVPSIYYSVSKRRLSYLLCLFTLLNIVKESSLWTILTLWHGSSPGYSALQERIQGGRVAIFRSPVVELAQECIDAVHPLGALPMHLCRWSSVPALKCCSHQPGAFISESCQSLDLFFKHFFFFPAWLWHPQMDFDENRNVSVLSME